MTTWNFVSNRYNKSREKVCTGDAVVRAHAAPLTQQIDHQTFLWQIVRGLANARRLQHPLVHECINFTDAMRNIPKQDELDHGVKESFHDWILAYSCRGSHSERCRRGAALASKSTPTHWRNCSMFWEGSLLAPQMQNPLTTFW